MHDKKKIIIGIFVFVIIIFIPFWLNINGQNKKAEPKLTEKAKKAEKCILPTNEMRNSHQVLLVDWRDMAIREGKRVYYSDYTNKEYEISLENTCMDCHSNKKDFCDECHNYAGVTGGISPNCWNCHNEPEE
ncbi:MAG: sulfate reduction electron transfer complex DsrMKJOP subunit DsrJ [Deferribacterota bacterium]|nr:sulfate reduction electron transfer complex DsrMKJOP subunit DsrJ [Deferribacterota bacterium]